MFGYINRNSELLFSTNDLRGSIEFIGQKMREEINGLDENRFLNTSTEDLKGYLVDKYNIIPVTLLIDQWTVSDSEVLVDVSHDPRRCFGRFDGPAMIPGVRFEVRVPFEGERDLLYMRSNRFSSNTPRAVINGNEIVLRYDYPADEKANIRSLIDRDVENIKQHLEWQADMIGTHNRDLPIIAEQAIGGRRERLLSRAQSVEALGIPIRQRTGAPNTYALPTVKRKVVPTLPSATTTKFIPEPVLEMKEYEHILKVVQSMALVIERSPSAFKSMGEEDLRQHFLVQLNGQYEGRATGETFNMKGKTDILIREGDRNVFIAECKFWKGPDGFRKTVDQLLGYMTWRDSKTAILVFNKGTQPSTVLSGIDKTIKEHSNFKRRVDWSHESGFRYVMHSNGDTNREMTLTVLVFNVPE